jgi:hypothetical protein
MTLPEAILVFSQVVTSCGVLYGIWISYRNSRKIDAVHRSTDGLAERAEQMAMHLGIEQGKAEEKANPT